MTDAGAAHRAEPVAAAPLSDIKDIEDNGTEASDRKPANLRPRHSRASTPPPHGSDPNPSPEPPRHTVADNDEQLRRDKPPHWG